MTVWKRIILVGFATGAVIGLISIAVVRVSAHRYPDLWARALDASSILFPTYIFLVPSADTESAANGMFFYSAAIIGNGIIYSVVAQIAAGLYFVAKTLLSHFA